MKIAFLFVLLFFLPFLLGQGTYTVSLLLFSRRSSVKPSMKKTSSKAPNKSSNKTSSWSLASTFLIGICEMLFLCEGVHLLTLVTGREISFAAKTFGILLLVLATLCYLLWMVQILLRYLPKLKGNASEKEAATAELSGSMSSDSSSSDSNSSDSRSFDTILLWTSIIVFFILLLFQIRRILSGAYVYTTGNEMAEMVQSLSSGSPFYTLNPLTGLPYLEGIPTHLKILCLPTFYAILCNTFQLPAVLLVWKIMPIFWLLCGYLSFSTLSKAIIAPKYRVVFLCIIAIFLFLTSSQVGLPGFDALSLGYLDTSVRSIVLIPFLISLLLDRRYILAIFPLLTESIICWTRFGFGTCFIIYVVLLVLLNCFGKMPRREVSYDTFFCIPRKR